MNYEKNNDNIFIATGGTGGHIIPAISLARYLNQNSYNVKLIGDSNLVKYCRNDNFFDYHQIYNAKISKNLSIFISIFKILLGFIQSLILIFKYRPKMIISFGGYSSFPVLLSAVISFRKIIIYEQNAHIGKVNRIFSRFASKILLAFENCDGIKQDFLKKTRFVGGIVREEFINARKQIIYKKSLVSNRRNNKFNILIIGGSGGASLFSRVLAPIVVKEFSNYKEQIHITQQCREEDRCFLQDLYDKHNFSCEVNDFFSDICNKMLDSDIVIARSGSSTIFELSALAKPSIIIPFAKSSDNHQLKNAKSFERYGGGVVIEEKDIKNNILTNIIKAHIESDNILQNCNKLSFDFFNLPLKYDSLLDNNSQETSPQISSEASIDCNFNLNLFLKNLR